MNRRKKQYSKIKVLLIGMGSFGRIIAETIDSLFDLYVFDTIYSSNTCKNYKFVSSAEHAQICDVVIVAVPIDQYRIVLNKYCHFAKPNSIWLDVGSVKALPCKIMEEILPNNVNIVGLHPLFGPQSIGNSVRNKKIVLCDVRSSRTNEIVYFLKYFGLRVIKMSAEEHDQNMAVVQGITHLFAKILSSFDPYSFEATTPSFDLLVRSFDMVNSDTSELYKTIETRNGYARGVRDKFLRIAKKECTSLSGERNGSHRESTLSIETRVDK